MDYLKRLWNEHWVEIKVNKTFALVVLVVLGFLWYGRYCYKKGMVDTLQYVMNQMSGDKQAPQDPTLNEPGKHDPEL